MKGFNLVTITCALTVFSLFLTAETSAQCISGNCQTGTGTYRYSATSRYTGQFQNSQRHGQGKMTYADGNVYEGTFFMGKKQGSEGSMFFASSGDRYVGAWKNDQPNGQGVYYFESKERYEGSFVNGVFEGEGTMYYPDGAYYAGEWSNNKKHGRGVLHYSDGTEKHGQWEMGKPVAAPDRITRNSTEKVENEPPAEQGNDEVGRESAGKVAAKPDLTGLRNCGATYCRSGKGYYRYPEGSIWVGEFKDGAPHGKGTCYYANGDRYEGEWESNKPNGEGVMKFANGRTYGAVWLNGSIVQELDSSEEIPEESVAVENSSDVKIWAVVVGVGKYTSMPTLKFTDDDAFRFYSHLKSPLGGALPDDQIEILVDEGATRENILRTMRRFFLKADENDVIMMYFSGHGLEGCFLPYDFDGYSNKLRHDEVRSIFMESKARHKICIADACHSGSLEYNSDMAARGGPAQVSLERYYRAFEESDGGIALLMSSKGEELSLEDKGLRQGVFTYYLLRGMKGEADTNDDNIVSVKELHTFVYNRVREYTGDQQTPVLTGKFDGNMPVSMHR